MPSIAFWRRGAYYFMMHYVYILKSKKYNEVYTGSTSNLKERVIEHNSGKSSHTKKFKPWKLVTYFAFEDKVTAQNFEEYLKTGSGIAFSRKHFNS